MKRLHNDRGVALILTILVVSLIVGFTIQFNTNMYKHVESARTNKDDLKALYAAKSGVSFALALLKAYDRPEVTTLFELKLQLSEEGKTVNQICEELGVQPAGESEDEGESDDTDWGDGGSEDTESGNEGQEDTELSPCSLGEFEPMDNCKFEIIDECGKIQLNSLPREIDQVDTQNRFLESYFRQFGLKGSHYEDMDAAYPWYEVLDWIDSDQDGRDAWGASDVDSKNGPLWSLQELKLIKELEPERLREIIESNEDLSEEGGYVTGDDLFNDIIGHLTIFEANEGNTGKINVNTASRKVLISLLMLHGDVLDPLTAEEKADLLEQYRCSGAVDSSQLASTDWFYQTANLPKNKDKNKDLERLITTKSDLFRIEAVGTAGNVEKHVTAVVKRATKSESGTDFHVVFWSVE